MTGFRATGEASYGARAPHNPTTLRRMYSVRQPGPRWRPPVEALKLRVEALLVAIRFATVNRGRAPAELHGMDRLEWANRNIPVKVTYVLPAEFDHFTPRHAWPIVLPIRGVG